MPDEEARRDNLKQTSYPEATIRFSDLVEINPAVDCSRLKPDDQVSFIPMADVTDNGQWIGKQTRVYAEVKNGYSTFREGDVLFAKITPCTENGKGCYAVGLTNGIGFGSTEFHILRVKPGVNARLIYHLSVAKEVRIYAASVMGGSAGQQRVPTDFFKLFRLFPSLLDNQERKADLFDAIDDTIEATRAVIEQTRRLKSALLQDLPTGGLPGRHNKFKIVRHLGRMPVTWDVRTIGEVFEVQLGKMLSQAAKTGKAYRPYIGNWNVQWGRFDLNHVEQMDFTDDEFEKFVLQPSDILVCEGGEVGRTALWKGEIENCCYQKALHRLRPRPSVKVIPEFFMYFMEQGTLQNIFLPFTGESSIAHLTRETLVQIPMPLPSYTEQETIVSVLEGVEARARAEEMKVQQLEKVKAALSQGLLTGRIPVGTPDKEMA